MRRVFVLGALVVLAMSCGSDDPGATGPNDDADGDTITNADEGANDTNTDGDSYADYIDLDSDADGILDSDEAGDGDLSTAPADSDEDGTPDFRDLDSDGDDIDDTDELDSDYQIVDTDGDGIPDHLDDDSDADTIADRHDGLSDRDLNGTANFRDLDSDSDGIPDAIEAGDDDLDSAPVDTDGDGEPNFLDLDSDNDFVPDADEDKNGDGVVDPGESDPTNSDTDGDGTPDLIEVIAGSDPNDPGVNIPPGDFYFVLPYEGPGDNGDLDFSTTVKQADVFFSMDTTGSFGEEIAAVQASLEMTIVPQIGMAIPDVAFGVGRFEDMPLDPYGLAGNRPYELLQPVTSDIMLVGTGLAALGPANGGLDTPESGFEALYQWASGAGIPELGLAPFAPPGIGGVGFRTDSLPIIVQITDAVSHDASDYLPMIQGAHDRAIAVAALNAIGARVIGIDSLENQGTADDPRAQLEQLALDTKAFIPTDAVTGMCNMGVNNAAVPPVQHMGQDVCPVVFDVQPDGTGLGSSIVDAVKQLAQLGVLDISTATIGKPQGINGEVITAGFDTSDFIKSVTPVAPPPAGSTIQGLIFANVQPGSTVTFNVDAFNDFQPSIQVDQLFDADIDVLGDIVTLLDVRNVYIIVPKEIPDTPAIN
jgi:hypothetical protein